MTSDPGGRSVRNEPTAERARTWRTPADRSAQRLARCETMTHAMPRHERDPTAAKQAERNVATGWPEGRVEAEWAGVVEQRVEAGPPDDADIGRRRDRAHSDDV